MEQINLEDLPKKTLVELLKVYSRNWQTLDGLWFGAVEAEFGLDTASRLDLGNWEKQSVLEAERLKKVLKLRGSLTSVLQVLSLMTWQLTSQLFEIDEETPERIVFHYSRCAVQEGRKKLNKPVFACKNMKLALLSNIAKAVEPKAVVRCLHCPPDERHTDFWCKWELTLRPAEKKAPPAVRYNT
ncbi:MAG: hypothetical protein HYX79_01745 [Chloroflexi bacterium]|nr:hypothetical protein [Chloroflexota bacterium]